ncbi:hypothetical protein TPHA_0M00170 [Tetrapisispora phaffii CBS 4417]|uniref:Karyogamy protein KAR9 n=1 Tax=Tetrapisispora phaffii (strain ATCC 24235 / CBS 4417 / NBRC 1672 / NRRL Y-8282 / UCD 70-5) TaxID=1071381 RepID=G8C0T4_TETPH|nr:hypothetical protein TPHA_0M00170 [Tetrapisispora phaffii CBS 4417]CCE65595.1 hypothetical protein TPHA_0M00170 [Tetrapisispora phaffii CBS 4417]
MEEQKDLEVIESLFPVSEFQDAIDCLKKLEELKIDDLSISLGKLYKLLSNLKLVINEIFISKINGKNANTVVIIDSIIKNKSSIAVILGGIYEIEGVLNHILNLLEELISENSSNISDCNNIFNLIENCTKVEHDLKRQFNVIKPNLDISIEFYEIMNDHMGTLDKLVEKKIQETVSIQEEKFSSPIRHAPNFTLNEIIEILDKNSYSNESKIPAFSPLEESLVERYLQLKEEIKPIELSLTEVLIKRINDFKNRDQNNIEALHALLLKHFKLLMDKYRFLVDEMRNLKLELIDRRWNIIFINLNNEISFLLESVESLQKKYTNNKASEILDKETNEKLICQLSLKSKIVTKTFNVIYKAFEISLVDAGISKKTNNLAKKWLELRPLNDALILFSETESKEMQDNKEIQKLTNHLNNLTLNGELKENEEMALQPNLDTIKTPKKKIGAALLRKMNIKPIIITDTPPPSIEKDNPFFKKNLDRMENSEGGNNEKGKDYNFKDQSITNDIPSLKFAASSDSMDRQLNNDKSDADKENVAYNNTIRELEYQKMQYFSKQKSRIPSINSEKSSKVVRSASLNLSHSKNSSPMMWTPFTKNTSAHLKLPTPKSQLLVKETGARSVTR